MPQTLSYLPLLGPLLMTAAAFPCFSRPGSRPRLAIKISRIASLLALASALAAGGILFLDGSTTRPLPGSLGLGFSIRLDMLSIILFCLVSFVGLIVLSFSHNYLDGDPRQGEFLGMLCLTLSAVMLLVLSGNLIQLVLAWIVVNLSVERLLLFYPARPRAAAAAAKKRIASRLGEACLILAVMLLIKVYGSSDIATILVSAREGVGAGQESAALAAGLLAAAALLNSAQFPAHAWLPETMESPTPVSALLHAGIINAGGFLVIRFADVLLAHTASLHLLGFVGGFTALFASLVMLPQTSVKVSLAYSTSAQLGFMFLQCAFGAFHLAVLHIVAHSLYKAHAFLSSGSVVEQGRVLPPDGKRAPVSPCRLALHFALACGVFLGTGSLLGLTADKQPTVFALGALLVMGLTHLLIQGQEMKGRSSGYVLCRTLILAMVISAAYFVLQTAAASLLASTLPPVGESGGVTGFIMALALVSFALLMIAQLYLQQWQNSFAAQRLYVLAANGFYVNALFNRLLVFSKRFESRCQGEKS